MNSTTLRRYSLPSKSIEGWAVIVIGSDGYFSTVSDFGNYAYMWSNPGCEFRKFLVNCNPSYFWGKITSGRDAHVWDEKTTLANIRSRLNELVIAGLLTQDGADLDYDKAESMGINSCGELLAWHNEVGLPDDFNVYEDLAAMMPEPQSWAFATKVLPRFQNILREELDIEAEEGAK